MKPDFKVDFTKKDVVKTVCLTVVLLLVLILGNTFGYVSADGVNNFFSQSEYVNSSVYDANNYFQGYIDDSNQYNATNSMVASSKIMSTDWSTIFTGSNTANVDSSTFKYYLITGSAYPSTWRVYFFTEDCYCFVGLNNLYYYTVILDSGSDFYYCDLTPYGNGTELQDPYVIFPDTLLHASAGYDAGFGKYSVPFTLSQSSTICMTNMPILTYRSNASFTQGSYLNDLLSYNSGNTNVNVYNINYLYDSEACPSLNGLDGLENVGGSYVPESAETSENNLYMQDAKWSFSMPKWSNLTSYSGNATYSASLNNFQQTNLSDFYLKFTFSIHTQQSYTSLGDGSSGSSGGGHGTEVSNSGNATTGYISGIFKYVDSSTSNDYVQVSLQDFYNMGSSKAFMTLNGIFDRCFKTGFSGNTSTTSFVSWYNEAISSARYTTTKAILYCYATLYDSNGNASGNCVYYYDLLNGTYGITDSSMTVNSNPYVDEDGNVSGTLPEESTTESSYNGNGVNVTQTVTVNNDNGNSKSWLWTLITSLISTDDENISEAGMSDTLVNFTGINPWISLMSSTLGFVPGTVWTTLSACFIVVMGILVVAFVLRIILDLL